MKKAELKIASISLPEEEAFKYFDIFRHTLSGTLGRNMLNMDFPLDQESNDGKANPERSDLMETREIDGRRCLVITIDDHLEVNGIEVH